MYSKFKNPISGLTHLGSALLALFGTMLLLIPAVRAGNRLQVIAFAIFGASLLLLYSASAAYHLIQAGEKGNLLLRRMDHMMIYVLIAGSYTPICLIALDKPFGSILLAVIWALAGLGMLLTLFIINTPRWLTVGIYIGMGWLALIAIRPLIQVLPASGIFWMVMGGLFYSSGAVIYVLKKPDWLPGVFGFHELWHLFVIAGSASHFVMMAAAVRYL